MTDKKLNGRVNLTKDERKQAVIKAQEAKESAFKLVVKIISWESGSLDSNTIRSDDRITKAEWLEYKKQRMNASADDNKEKAKEKITQTYNSIKANGGFKGF